MPGKKLSTVPAMSSEAMPAPSSVMRTEPRDLSTFFLMLIFSLVQMR